MNNAALEHLLQIASPPRDAGQSASRSRSDSAPFDSLFRQASEPQARAKGANQPAPSSSPAFEARPGNSTSAPSKNEPAAIQDSAKNTNSEYAAATSTAQEDHDESERDDLESTDTVAVAAVATPTAAPADEAAAEVEFVGEVEQAIDAAAESDVSSKAKSQTKAITVAAAHDEVPSDESVAAVESTEDTSKTKEAAPVDPVVEAALESNTTPNAEIAAATDVAAPATQTMKGKPRTTSKEHEDNTETAPTQAVDANSDPAAEQSTATQAADPAADSQPSFETAVGESAWHDADAQPAATRTDSRTDEQTTMTNANRHGASAPVRPAAATSAPIAANIQQQTHAAEAATHNVAAADAKSNTTAIRTKDSPLSPFARLERNQPGSARGTHGTADGNATHHVDPARFVSRVARAIHTAQERGGPLQIRLSPPELGAMRMELSVKQGTLTATIETDNAAARQVLLENLPALRERLAEQNVKIERFDVDVRRDGNGEQHPAAQQQNDEPQHGRAATRGQSLRNATNQTTGDEPVALRRTITTSTINVIA